MLSLRIPPSKRLATITLCIYENYYNYTNSYFISDMGLFKLGYYTLPIIQNQNLMPHFCLKKLRMIDLIRLIEFICSFS